MRTYTHVRNNTSSVIILCDAEEMLLRYVHDVMLYDAYNYIAIEPVKVVLQLQSNLFDCLLCIL